MRCAGRQRWIRDLDNAVAAILDQYAEPGRREVYRLKAIWCKKHRTRCVCVVAGELLVHIHWERTKPEAVAISLLEGMLPAVATVGQSELARPPAGLPPASAAASGAWAFVARN